MAFANIGEGRAQRPYAAPFPSIGAAPVPGPQAPGQGYNPNDPNQAVHPDYGQALDPNQTVRPQVGPMPYGTVQPPHMAGATDSYSNPLPPVYQPQAPGPSAAAPPTVGSNNVSGGGGYLADPGYQLALQQQQMGIAQLDAQTKAAIEQAITNFGDPALASMAGFGLDPQAAAFARQNYLSGNAALARLDKQHEQARKAVIDRLAGRGLLFSGDLGYGVGEADSQYGNQVYDARQALLQYLNGVQSQALAQKQSLGSAVVNALQNAYSNVLSHPELLDGYTSSQPPANTTVQPPQVPKTIPAASAPKKSAVVKALTNPYSTGQKKRG